MKKIQTANSSIALNSSYPKAYLNQTNPMITKDCRGCEMWSVKDLIYCIGHTSDTNLKSLWMVYGDIYAANEDIYERIKTTISDGIKTIPNVIFSETRELGRVNKVDPLGITNLRIRGMWQLENPKKVFDYLYKSDGKEFELNCLIPKDKYDKFPETSRAKVESIKEIGFGIEDTQVKNPNNPARLVDVKFIKFCI